MTIPNETLQAMMRAYHGFELTDEELELVRPELDNYLQGGRDTPYPGPLGRAVGSPPAGPRRGATLMADTALLKLTIAELASKIKGKKGVSPVELTEAALAQADRLQPTLNAFITILHEQARRQAREQEAALMRGQYRGPLHGIPIGIKDNIATAGIRTTVGSKVLADHVPQEDAYVVSRCKEAGAIIIGKENLEEFAAGSTSNNLHYGAVHNPWNLDHIPGGSSGGGGANVAACVTFASLGTDLGGSVRGPANFCGVVGLKQTFGRVSQRGLLVTSFNGDHIGPITRSVRDSALLLQAIAGYDPLEPSTVPVPVPDFSALLGRELRGLRMGIPTNYYFDLIDPQVETAVRQAISALKLSGWRPGSGLPQHAIRWRSAHRRHGGQCGDPRAISEDAPTRLWPHGALPYPGGAIRAGTRLLQGAESPAPDQGGVRPCPPGRRRAGDASRARCCLAY